MLSYSRHIPPFIQPKYSHSTPSRPISLKHILILPSHLCLGQVGSSLVPLSWRRTSLKNYYLTIRTHISIIQKTTRIFCSGFRAKYFIFMYLFPYALHALPHLIHLRSIIHILSSREYEVWRSLICNFPSLVALPPSLLGPNVTPSTMFS
jgi:hypothetical protein